MKILEKWGAGLVRPDDIPIDVFVTELAFYSLGRKTVENFLKNEGILRNILVKLRKF